MTPLSKISTIGRLSKTQPPQNLFVQQIKLLTHFCASIFFILFDKQENQNQNHKTKRHPNQRPKDNRTKQHNKRQHSHYNANILFPIPHTIQPLPFDEYSIAQRGILVNHIFICSTNNFSLDKIRILCYNTIVPKEQTKHNRKAVLR